MKTPDKQIWTILKYTSILILALIFIFLHLERTYHTSDHAGSCDNISRHLNPITLQICNKMTITFWCFNNVFEMASTPQQRFENVLVTNIP